EAPGLGGPVDVPPDPMDTRQADREPALDEADDWLIPVPVDRRHQGSLRCEREKVVYAGFIATGSQTRTAGPTPGAARAAVAVKDLAAAPGGRLRPLK